MKASAPKPSTNSTNRSPPLRAREREHQQRRPAQERDPRERAPRRRSGSVGGPGDALPRRQPGRAEPHAQVLGEQDEPAERGQRDDRERHQRGHEVRQPVEVARVAEVAPSGRPAPPARRPAAAPTSEHRVPARRGERARDEHDEPEHGAAPRRRPAARPRRRRPSPARARRPAAGPRARSHAPPARRERRAPGAAARPSRPCSALRRARPAHQSIDPLLVRSWTLRRARHSRTIAFASARARGRSCPAAPRGTRDSRASPVGSRGRHRSG